MKICDRIRYCIYFAVNDTGNCLFMTEYKGFDKNPKKKKKKRHTFP